MNEDSPACISQLRGDLYLSRNLELRVDFGRAQLVGSRMLCYTPYAYLLNPF